MSYEIEQVKQRETDLTKAFRDIFPLAGEKDLPWTSSQIKGFLRDRMARIVVEEAKKARADRIKLEKAVDLMAERDEMLQRFREIGKIIGCGHVEDSDGRQVLVRCIRETVEAAGNVVNPPAVASK